MSGNTIHSFQEKVAELRTVHPAFKVKNRKIGVSFNPVDELEDTIRKLVYIL